MRNWAVFGTLALLVTARLPAEEGTRSTPAATYRLREDGRTPLISSGQRCGAAKRVRASRSADCYLLADYETGAVHKFDLQGQWLLTLGKDGPGRLQMPWAATAVGERIHVADPGRQEILVFGRDGTYLESIKQPEAAVLLPLDGGGILAAGLRAAADGKPRWFHFLGPAGEVRRSVLDFGPASTELISYGVDKPGACMTAQGTILLLRPTEYRVFEVNAAGDLLREFGTPPSTHRAPLLPPPSERPYKWDSAGRRALMANWTTLQGVAADSKYVYVFRLSVDATGPAHRFLVDVLDPSGKPIAHDITTTLWPIGADPNGGLLLLDRARADLAVVHASVVP